MWSKLRRGRPHRHRLQSRGRRTGFDIDGDVLIYQLEYFDGKSWTLVADKLTDTKYTFVIPDTLASTNGLKFRVNASDAEYTSDYGYSAR